MRRLLFGLAPIGVALALGVARPAAQELAGTLDLMIDRLPPGTVVSVTIDIGKIPVTSGKGVAAAGEVALALSLGSLPKAEETEVNIFVGDCPNKEVRIWFVLQGKEPPQECSRRRVGGAFWINRQTRVRIHYPDGVVIGGGGFMSPRNLGLIGGGAAAVIVGLSLAGDDDDDDGDNGGGNGPDFPSYNGTYTGTGTAVENGCNFFPSAPLRGVLNLLTGGTGTWVKTHTQTNVTFNVNVVATAITGGINFTGSIASQQVGANAYSVADTASIAGTTLTLTQVFTRLTGTPCTVRYTATMTKNAA